MRERRGHLDLQRRHVADGNPEHARRHQQQPEVQLRPVLERPERGQLPHDEDKGKHDEDGIDVVVQLQAPYVVADGGKNLLGVDGVQGNTEAGQHPAHDTKYGEVLD